METYLGATPFGRRGMTLAVLASQQNVDHMQSNLVRDKWKLFRAICEARPALGVTDRALTVLDALLTFYPETELSESRGLVVFPSNTQLSLRARGMTPATLRRHLASLVEAGLILRKDSPNGKRYARRNKAGDISQAFGFSLAPLLARAVEIETIAHKIHSDREQLRLYREELSLCRRDISKLLSALTERGEAEAIECLNTRFQILLTQIPRVPTNAQIEPLLVHMETIRTDILNLLKPNIKTRNLSSNESQIERHIEDSNPESLIEYRSNEKNEGKPSSNDAKQFSSSAQKQGYGVEKEVYSKNHVFPLDLIVRACPEISSYGPSDGIKTWSDLFNASAIVRRMLCVSDSAYIHAHQTLGQHNTATVIACLLEKVSHIKSAGSYLRNLTSRAERKEFSVQPMLMSLLRTHKLPYGGKGISTE